MKKSEFRIPTALRTAGLALGVAALLAQPVGAYTLVDNFQSYTVGNFSSSNPTDTGSGPVWFPTTATSFVAIQDDGGDQYLALGWNSGRRGAYRDVPDIANGDTGTYYFQIRSLDSSPDVSFGLTDLSSPTLTGGGDFNDFEVQVALIGAGPTFDLRARNGGVINTLQTGLAVNTWYDVWVSVNNLTDTYDVYFGTTGSPNILGSLVGSNLAFRNGTTDALTSFLALFQNNNGDRLAHLNNIYYSPGLVPEPGSLTLVGLGFAGWLWMRRRQQN